MKIALLGDMAFYGQFSVEGGSRVFDYFSDIAEYLAGFDFVIGNLETPLCSDLKTKGPKSAYIRSVPENVELLNYLNIKAVNLANNHIFDYGWDGYSQTLDGLRANDIQCFGVNEDEVTLTDKSAKVALHGYCSFNTNPLGVSNRPGHGLNVLNLERVEKRLRENCENGFLNIVSIHSGQEHVNYPSRDDIRVARFLAEITPYVYYGHHPHVMQGVEEINDSIIAYSLGNFCFADVYTSRSREPLIRQTDNNKTGLILELEVKGNRVINYKFTPIFAGRNSLSLNPKGASESLNNYSAALKDDSVAYEQRRSALLSSFSASRKSARDLQWYFKRLNLNSVGIVLRAIYNRRQYNRNVIRYLERIESTLDASKYLP